MRLSTDCYAYYLGLNKFASGFKTRKLSREDFAELSETIYRTISENISDNDGGVYIDNIGYFCHTVRPERKLRKSQYGGGIARMATNGHKVNHQCIDFAKSDQYYHIGTDLAHPLIVRCRSKVRRGFFYKLFFNEAESYSSLLEKPVVKYKIGIRSTKNK